MIPSCDSQVAMADEDACCVDHCKRVGAWVCDRNIGGCLRCGRTVCQEHVTLRGSSASFCPAHAPDRARKPERMHGPAVWP